MSPLLWLAVFSAICLPGAVLLAWAQHRGWPPWTALSVALATICTVMFTVEHAVGLGRLRGTGGLLLIASAVLAVIGARQGGFHRRLLLMSLPFLPPWRSGCCGAAVTPVCFPAPSA